MHILYMGPMGYYYVYLLGCVEVDETQDTHRSPCEISGEKHVIQTPGGIYMVLLSDGYPLFEEDL